MGIGFKQSFYNLIYLSLGVLIGGVSTIFVYPKVFGDNLDQWGIIQTILAFTVIGAQLFSFGIPNISVKFFPQLKKEGQEGYLIYLSTFIPAIFLFGLGIYVFFFRDSFLELFSDSIAIELDKYLPAVFLIVATSTFFKTFYGYSSARLKSTFPVFLSEVLIRILLLTGIVLYYLDKFDFSELIYFFSISYFIQALLLILYNLSGILKYQTSQSVVSRKSIYNYGLTALLEGGTSTLTMKLDIVMVASLITLDDVAFYSLGLFIGTLVALPQRAMTGIMLPLVSKAWANEDRKELLSLYQKTALHQMLFGGFILILIIIGLDPLFDIIGEKFIAAKPIAIIIGLARLIDISAGINGGIIVTSKHYRVNLYLNIVLLILTISCNLILIPIYGGIGAALATMISYLVFNVSKTIYVWHKFKLQPFTNKTLISLIIISSILLFIYYLPLSIEAPILEVIVKASIAAVLFAISVVIFNVSSDINALWNKVYENLLRR